MQTKHPKYKLTLVVAGQSFEPRSVDVIEANNLLELVSQIPMIIRKVTEQELEFLRNEVEKWKAQSHVNEDDIPF